MRHSRVNSPRSNHTVLDPIVDDLIARAKPFGHLLDSQLLRPLELGRWNPIPATDPLDDFHRVRLTFGAALSLPIELIGDLGIGQVASEFSYSVDHRGRVAHAVRYVGRELHTDVATGAALPAPRRCARSRPFGRVDLGVARPGGAHFISGWFEPHLPLAQDPPISRFQFV